MVLVQLIYYHPIFASPVREKNNTSLFAVGVIQLGTPDFYDKSFVSRSLGIALPLCVVKLVDFCF